MRLNSQLVNSGTVIPADDGKEIEFCGSMVNGIAEEVAKLLEVNERLDNLAIFGPRGVDEDFVVRISDTPLN